MSCRLVLASHNRKKAAELRDLLLPLGWLLETLADFPGAPEPAEDGDTFEENAIIKAESALRFTGLPSLADDSGLIVDVLDGEPGVHSARYAGANADDAANNRLLLKKMEAIPDERRTARFVSVIAFVRPGEETRLYRGETSGRIMHAPRGLHGFGYDPLFMSDDLGVTFAEAGAEDKNRVSHRGRALARFIHDISGNG